MTKRSNTQFLQFNSKRGFAGYSDIISHSSVRDTGKRMKIRRGDLLRAVLKGNTSTLGFHRRHRNKALRDPKAGNHI